MKKTFMKRIFKVVLSACVVANSILVMPATCGRAATESLPKSYSSVDKGYVTAVKDQGKWGTCWTFATLAAVETSLVKQGLAEKDIDLSELALAYFMFNEQVDPLGLTAGDGVKAVHSSWLDEGGYMNWACWLLAMNQGLVYEDAAPYAKASEKTVVKPELAYGSTPYAVKNIYWAPIRERDSIKTLIRDYGGVVVSYYMNEAFFNQDRSAYNWDRSEDAKGHAGFIVGWDDDYPASNFKVKPSSNGAWLVKNSWGSDDNENGFFWMSYECSTQEDGDPWYQPCYAVEMQKREYDNVYQYDGTCGESYEGGGMKSANVFRTYGKERLEAVSFAFDEDEVTYTVKVYTNLKDVSDPASGRLSASVSGTSHYAGYRVVDITPVELPADCLYSVVVEGTRGGVGARVLLESTSAFPCMDVSASMMEGTSWVYEEWSGWTPADNNCRIKAFTCDLEKPAAESEAVKLNGLKKDGYTFFYNHTDKSFNISKYEGTATKLSVPAEINGIPVKSILGEAFSGNKTLRNVTIDGISVINPKAFEGTKLENVTVKNVSDIGMMAFANCNLKSVCLENVSGEIGFGAFSGNDGITDFRLLGHFGSILSGAFGTCPNLKKIEFPSVDHLENPFSWAGGVEEIVINGDVQDLSFTVFSLVDYKTDKVSEYSGCFDDISIKLKRLTINGKIHDISKAIFAAPNSTLDAAALAKLADGIEITVTDCEDGLLFSPDKSELLMVFPYPASDTFTISEDMNVNDNAFTMVKGLKHLICEGDQYRTLYLKNMCDLETVDLGVNGQAYFEGFMPKLTDIYASGETACFSHSENSLPVEAGYISKFGFTEHEVTVHAPADSKISEDAFFAGYSFEDTVSGTLTERKPKIQGDYIITEDNRFLLGRKRKNGSENVPEVEVICNGVYSLYDDNAGASAYSLTDVAIPDSVKVIGRGAFKFNNLTGISLPASLEVIGREAFADCGYFDVWDLGDALYKVEDGAFSETYINELIFPETFHSLSAQTISGVNAKSLVFKGDLQIDLQRGGLLDALWREPDRITVLGEAELIGFGPVAYSYSLTLFKPSHKDMLYYNLLHFGAQMEVDAEALPEAKTPVDPERAEMLFAALETYAQSGYPYSIFPYSYETIDRAPRDENGNFLFTDELVYEGVGLWDDPEQTDTDGPEVTEENTEAIDNPELINEGGADDSRENTDMSEDREDSGENTKGPVIVIVAVVVLLALGSVLFVLIGKRKKK